MAAMIDRLNAALEDRYRIERELGEGGMATVYLVEDLKHERNVHPTYAVAPNNQRFLFARGQPTPGTLVLVQNWFQELRERVEGSS